MGGSEGFFSRLYNRIVGNKSAEVSPPTVPEHDSEKARRDWDKVKNRISDIAKLAPDSTGKTLVVNEAYHEEVLNPRHPAKHSASDMVFQVEYPKDAQRKLDALHINPSNELHTAAKEVFDTTALPGKNTNGEAAFVMTPKKGTLYAGVHQSGTLHHTTYSGANPVVMAGMMAVEKGKIKTVDDDSGHYQPKAEHLARGLSRLPEEVFDPGATVTTSNRDSNGKVTGKTTLGIKEFLAEHPQPSASHSNEQLNRENIALAQQANLTDDGHIAPVNKSKIAAWAARLSEGPALERTQSLEQLPAHRPELQNKSYSTGVNHDSLPKKPPQNFGNPLAGHGDFAGSPSSVPVNKTVAVKTRSQ